MNVKTTASILLTLLTLSACQPQSGKSTAKVNPKPVPQETPAVPGEIITNKNVITAEGIEFLLSKDSDEYSWRDVAFVGSLNKYKVKVRIPMNIATAVRLSSVDLNTERVDELLPEDAAIVDGKFEWIQQHIFNAYDYAPKNISYRVETAEGLVTKTSFELLPDLLIEGKKSASNIKLFAGSYRFANIVLTKEAILRKQNLELNFTAQNMYVDDAQIITFAENESPAEIGMPGADGNTLKINVSRIEGNIIFKMYGQKGGQGYPGIDRSNDPKGKDGLAGSPAEVRWGVPAGSAGGGIGGLGTPPSCKKKPTNGAPGDNGVPGGDGYEGAKGGKSGHVILTYDHAENFRSDVIVKEGAGGDGGVGGAGGPPGQGGAAGAPPVKGAKFCPAASKGANGQIGNRGKNGKVGEPGGIEKSCISQKNENSKCGQEISL